MKPRKTKAAHSVAKLRLPLKSDADFQEQVDEFLKGLRIEQELIRLRKDQGLTQSAVASLLKVTQPFIAKMESGQLTNIELKTLARAVFALNGRLEIKIRSNNSSRAGSARAAKAHA